MSDPSPRRSLAAPLGLAALGVSLLASCVSREIEVEERNVVFPSLRGTFWDGARSEAVVDHALELDLAYGAGEDLQMLGVGESVNLDGMTFTGPGTLQNEVDLTAGSATWRMDFLSPGDGVSFGGALLLGAAFTNLDIEISNGAVSERSTLANGGPILGGQFHIQPRPWIELHVRSTIQVGISDDPSSLATWEAGLELEPHPTIGLFAGWRWWNYDKEVPGSDIDLELSGPTFGLHFEH